MFASVVRAPCSVINGALPSDRRSSQNYLFGVHRPLGRRTVLGFTIRCSRYLLTRSALGVGLVLSGELVYYTSPHPFCQAFFSLSQNKVFPPSFSLSRLTFFGVLPPVSALFGHEYFLYFVGYSCFSHEIMNRNRAMGVVIWLLFGCCLVVLWLRRGGGSVVPGSRHGTTRAVILSGAQRSEGSVFVLFPPVGDMRERDSSLRSE